MQKPVIKAELLRTGIALLWLLAVVVLMCIVQMRGDTVFVQERGIQPQDYQNPPIIDVVHERFPVVPPDSWINADTLLDSFLALSVVAGIIHWYNLRLFVINARRFIWLLGFGYFLRSITLAVTTLPPSNTFRWPRAFTLKETIIYLPLMVIGRVYACTDKIFSGHTTVATLLFWFWWDCQRLSLWTLYAFIHAGSMAVASVAGHRHYSVDIIVAVMINTLSFFVYKFLLGVSEYKSERGKQNITDFKYEHVPRCLVNFIGWLDGVRLRKEKIQSSEAAIP